MLFDATDSVVFLSAAGCDNVALQALKEGLCLRCRSGFGRHDALRGYLKQLGIRIGVDPALVERIASELGLPAAYFYAVEDDEANLLQWFYSLNTEEREELMQRVKLGS